MEKFIQWCENATMSHEVLMPLPTEDEQNNKMNGFPSS